MKRYICGAKDYRADLLDQRFGVSKESRATVSLMGDKKLLELTQPNLRCLREGLNKNINCGIFHGEGGV